MRDVREPTTPTPGGHRANRWPPDPLWRLSGAGLLLAAGGIHLDLYLTGYRNIPTIGALFVLQFAVATVLSVALVVVPGRVVAAGGAAFAASTVGGYVLSLWTGLLGFDEVRTAAGVVAGAVEVAAVGVLGAYAARRAPAELAAARAGGAMGAGGGAGAARARRLVAPVTFLAALALVLAVANAPGTPPRATASRAEGSAPGSRSPASADAPGAAAGQARPGSGAPGTATGSHAAATVSIRNFAFVPAKLTVAPGERILVTDHDSVTHTFTAMPGSSPDGHFSSGDIAPGVTVEVTAPTAAGSYAFYCAIHPFMTGTLVVS